MIKVSVVGITGFTGLELMKILLNHKGVEIAHLCSRSRVGEPIFKVYPQFSGVIDRVVEPIDVELLKESDLVFLALPHTVSSVIAKSLFGKTKIIDLSADFRLKDPTVYSKWYGVEHPAFELLGEAVYGLSELNREMIAQAQLVANPGCYATSVILAVAPVAQFLEGAVIADSKSGVSGAGRGFKEGLEFCEVNENFRAYSVSGHRHIPEMEQELKNFNENIRIAFIPHLLPVQRGILSTVYMQVEREVDFFKLYSDFFNRDYFVRVVNSLPSLNSVKGTNFCDIYPYYDRRTKRLIVVSVIDNMIKGASGQAVQNMNIMFGLDEKEGLGGFVFYP